MENTKEFSINPTTVNSVWRMLANRYWIPEMHSPALVTRLEFPSCLTTHRVENHCFGMNGKGFRGGDVHQRNTAHLSSAFMKLDI